MTKSLLTPVETPRDDAAFRAAVAEGLAQADAGLATPFEDVAVWLETWGGEDETPLAE